MLQREPTALMCDLKLVNLSVYASTTNFVIEVVVIVIVTFSRFQMIFELDFNIRFK